jgi:hypothetical protein
VVSDPVDIEVGTMAVALLRGVEKQLHVARQIKGKPDAFAAYDLALREAKAADSRSFQPRAIGAAAARGTAIRDMPATVW